MAAKTDWIPSREQNLADSCRVWKAGLKDPDNVAAFRRDQAEAAAVSEAADSSVIRQLRIRFRDHGTTKRGKPRGTSGAEIRWAIMDHPPVSDRDLANWDFCAASPFTLTFDENQRAHWLYFCLRRRSASKVTGLFSEIYSAVIPCPPRRGFT
jgi:hypothetical protein